MAAMPPRLLYRLFPLAGRTSAFVERRFSPAGRLVLGLLVAGALFGIDIRQTVGYQVAALMSALLATSIAFSLRWRPSLEVVRVLPEQVTASLPATYWIEITNHGRRPERDLIVHDRVAQPRIGYDEFVRARRADAGGARNFFDRAVGFPRWVELRRRARGIDTGPRAVPSIAPGATVRVRVEAVPHRRGWIRFEAIDLLKPDPLGLCRARHACALRGEMLALPRRYPMPRIHLRSERRYQKGGVSLALAVGDSQEFSSLRDYRPGDPRRHIHWRSFAKTGTLIVKEYQDEYFDRHALVVDTHLAGTGTARLEAVVSIAASVVAGERPRDAILDILFAGTEVIQLSAGRGLGDALHALAWLAEVEPAPDGRFEQLAELLRSRADALASAVVVLGGFDAQRRALLETLAKLGLPAFGLVVLDEPERDDVPATIGALRVHTVRPAALAEDLARVDLRG